MFIATAGMIMISLLRDKFVRSENLRPCCFEPMRRNSVFDELRSAVSQILPEDCHCMLNKIN